MLITQKKFFSINVLVANIPNTPSVHTKCMKSLNLLTKYVHSMSRKPNNGRKNCKNNTDSRGMQHNLSNLSFCFHFVEWSSLQMPTQELVQPKSIAFSVGIYCDYFISCGWVKECAESRKKASFLIYFGS